MKNPRFCRRTLLQSLGIGAGFLPLLHAERAPAQSANGYPTRLITITWTNGIVPSGFYPPAGPINAPLPELLSPLEAHKDKILALRSSDRQKSPIDLQVMLDANETYNGHQSYPALLTGTWRNGTTANGASIDVMIAEHLSSLGVVAPLLNLGARPYSSSTSYRASGERNSSQTDPYRLLGTLFAGVPSMPGTTPPSDPGTVTDADALRARRGSVLDFVGGELERFGSRLGTDDRAKVELHLEAIRELERRLEAQAGGTGGTGTTGGGVPVGTGCAAPSLPDKPNFQDIQNYPAHVAATLAVAGAAVKCDLARCITIDLIDDGGGNSLTFPWLDIHSPDYHAIAHEGPNSYGEKTEIDRWFFSEIAKLVADLANTPEGSGSVLDNTCILIANDMNEGSNHYVGDIPYLIIGGCGGFFKQGETVALSQNVPNNRLLTTVCHAMGLELEGIGDYSGNLDAELRA
jgi:hypothetical protein